MGLLLVDAARAHQDRRFWATGFDLAQGRATLKNSQDSALGLHLRDDCGARDRFVASADTPSRPMKYLAIKLRLRGRWRA
jgi:hypothetical protein